MQVEETMTQSGYGGFRFKILYKVGDGPSSDRELKNLKRVHLDISLGVDLQAFATRATMGPILDLFNQVSWNIYPLEFIAAEKIHSLLMRGDLNTRGKDIYDLNFLLNDLSAKKIERAIKKIFTLRNFSVTSLFDEAKQIDIENLKRSFNKSQFKDRDMEFDACMKNILGKFKEIDKLKE